MAGKNAGIVSKSFHSKQTQCSGERRAACWWYISTTHTRIRNSCKAPPRLCMGQTISSTYSTLTDKPPDFLTQSSSCWQGRMRHHSGRAAVGARRSSGSLEGVPIAMVAAIVALEVSFAVPPSSKHLTISFPRFALVTEPGCGGSVLWLLGSGWWRTVRSKIDGFCFLGGLQG